MLVIIKSLGSIESYYLCSYIDELLIQNPAYKDINIQILDIITNQSLAQKYHYSCIPSLFVDGVEQICGNIEKNNVQKIFDSILQ